jgi:restriction system protein
MAPGGVDLDTRGFIFMTDTEAVIWGIHVTGVQGDAMFREKQIIGIGWGGLGNLRDIRADREAYKAAVRPHFPNKPNGYVVNAASQLFRFVNEMKQGDWVVYRSSFDRHLYVGRIAGDYRFDPAVSDEYPNTRAVMWQKTLPLTAVSQGALHELGSALTLFQLRNYGDEFLEATAEKASTSDQEDDEAVASVTTEVQQTTEDFILRSLAKHLKGYSLQAFVANLLSTMGYRTIESKRGADEGVDITAHRDELKLEPPIIKVQVKSTEGSVGRPDVQALLGCLGTGEYGLLVTLGGYTGQALDFAKSKGPIQLIDGARLVKLVMAHYESLDPKFRAIIPLKRVYVPSPAPDAESS